jgi:hypothetical protein
MGTQGWSTYWNEFKKKFKDDRQGNKRSKSDVDSEELHDVKKTAKDVQHEKRHKKAPGKVNI